MAVTDRSAVHSVHSVRSVRRALWSAACLALMPAAAGGQTFGGTGSNNCLPFACATPPQRYQEVYAGSGFGGPTLIGSITFYGATAASFPFVDGTFGDATFDLYLAHSTNGPATLDQANLDNNVTSGRTHFATIVGSSVAPFTNVQAITFGGVPYLFDPAGGQNLLLDVVVSNVVASGSFGPLDFGVSTNSARAFVTSSGVGDDAAAMGLRVTFGGRIAVAPEPGGIALLATGLLALGVLARRGRV